MAQRISETRAERDWFRVLMEAQDVNGRIEEMWFENLCRRALGQRELGGKRRAERLRQLRRRSKELSRELARVSKQMKPPRRR